MEFKKILKLAAEKQQKIEKEHSTIVKNSFSTKLAPPKKEVKVAKGINSSSVRAFLEESEKKNDSEKSVRKQDRPNGAPTSTSVLSPEDTSKDIDLCHLFTKHDRRVAHASDKVIPNMLSLLKEKEKAKREKEEAERKATRERENQALQEREREKEAEREAKLWQKIGIESKSNGSHHHHHHHSLKRPHSKSPTGHRKDSSGGAPKFKIPKKSQAPVLNFEELMKIAEQKAKEPPVVLNKVVEVPVAKPPPSKEPQRLMTQEEKDRLERRNSKAYQEWLKLGGMPPKTSSERQSSSTTAVDSKKVEGDRNKIKKIDDRGGSKHERHASSGTQEAQKSSVHRTSDGRPAPSSSKSVSSNHQRHASDGRSIRDEMSSNKSASSNHQRHASDGRLIRDESSSNKTTSSNHQRNNADARPTRDEHSSNKSASSSHHRHASDGRREESSSSGHHRHTSNGNAVRDKLVNRSEEKLARKDPERGASSSKENHNKPSREIQRKCDSDISNLKLQRSGNSGKTLDGGSRRDEVASRSRDHGRSRSPKNNGSQRSADKSTVDSTAEMFLNFLEQYEKLKNTGARKEEIIEKFKQLTKGSKSDQIDIFNKSSSNDVPLKAKSSQPEANRVKSQSSTSLKSTDRQVDEKRYKIQDSKSAQGSNRDQSMKSVQNSKSVQISKSVTVTTTSKPVQNSKPVQTTKPIKSSEPVSSKPGPSSSNVNGKTESGKYVTPWDRIYDEMKKNSKSRQEKKRPAFEDSDEDEEDEEDYDDYDDDLDDFIDDGPVEEDRGFNYSKHIRDIFGYDKRRFIDDDDDDPNMESSFAQVQKEEIRSAKLGKLEDLEDMRMEEEENKRKMLMKKGKKLKK